MALDADRLAALIFFRLSFSSFDKLVDEPIWITWEIELEEEADAVGWAGGGADDGRVDDRGALYLVADEKEVEG